MKEHFWVNVNGNFMDISILEWCKLFGDRRGHHHWRKVITNQKYFLAALLDAIDQTEEEFEAYIKEIRNYRDKFIAHLDSDERINIPKLKVARKSVYFLYEYLLTNEEEDYCFQDAPPDASSFYKHFYSKGQKFYSKLK